MASERPLCFITYLMYATARWNSDRSQGASSKHHTLYMLFIFYISVIGAKSNLLETTISQFYVAKGTEEQRRN